MRKVYISPLLLLLSILFFSCFYFYSNRDSSSNNVVTQIFENNEVDKDEILTEESDIYKNESLGISFTSPTGLQIEDSNYYTLLTSINPNYEDSLVHMVITKDKTNMNNEALENLKTPIDNPVFQTINIGDQVLTPTRLTYTEIGQSSSDPCQKTLVLDSYYITEFPNFDIVINQQNIDYECDVEPFILTNNDQISEMKSILEDLNTFTPVTEEMPSEIRTFTSEVTGLTFDYDFAQLGEAYVMSSENIVCAINSNIPIERVGFENEGLVVIVNEGCGRGGGGPALFGTGEYELINNDNEVMTVILGSKWDQPYLNSIRATLNVMDIQIEGSNGFLTERDREWLEGNVEIIVESLSYN